jgi:hypothetical protein
MSKTTARAWAEALENLADPGKKKACKLLQAFGELIDT